MKKLLILLGMTGAFQFVFAQTPLTNLGTDIGGSYINYTNVVYAGFKQTRVLESSTTVAGTRKWEWNSDGYFNTWRASAASQILAGYNTVISPANNNASAFWRNNFGGVSAFLPVTTSGRYYTFNITYSGTTYQSQRMLVLETVFNPVIISTVTQAAGTFGSRTITITTSATPNAAESIFVRYSTNSFSSSTIVQATGSGNTWTATIPWQSGAVGFYVYSSNRSKAAIDADVTSFSSQEIHDLSTLNLNNNGGSNYSWTPVTGSVIVSSTGGSFAGGIGYTSLTNAGGAFASLNTASAGTGAVTISVAAA